MNLTHLMPVLSSYRNQSIYLHSKTIGRFLYEGNTDIEWVNVNNWIFWEQLQFLRPIMTASKSGKKINRWRDVGVLNEMYRVFRDVSTTITTFLKQNLPTTSVTFGTKNVKPACLLNFLLNSFFFRNIIEVFWTWLSSSSLIYFLHTTCKF